MGQGIVAGMAAAAFWIFIASVVVAGIWSEVKEKEGRQRTIRELLARSDTLDADAVDRLVALIEGDKQRNARETRDGLRIAYRILFPIAPGLALLGLLVGAALPLLGVAALVACVAVGLMLAANGIDVDEPVG